MAMRPPRAGGGVLLPDTEVRQQPFPLSTDGIEGMHLPDVGPSTLSQLRPVVAAVPEAARGLDEPLPRPICGNTKASLVDHAVRVAEQRQNRDTVTPRLEIRIRPAFDGRRADESDRAREALLQ